MRQLPIKALGAVMLFHICSVCGAAEEQAEGRNAGDIREFKLPGGRVMPFVWCPPGRFLMGDSASETLPPNEKRAQVEVTLSRGFWIGQTEVTQAQWLSLGEPGPWKIWKGYPEKDDLPAMIVTWERATAFCDALTRRLRTDGKLPEGWEFRLPTSAEWEYACRAGTKTTYSFGADAAKLDDYGWHHENHRGASPPRVGLKKPNPWGLYDMHGGAWEWCCDVVAKPVGGLDPVTLKGGPLRVMRGGAYDFGAESARSAAVSGRSPDDALGNNGLRIVLVTPASLLDGGRQTNEQIVSAGIRRFHERMRSDNPEVRRSEFDETMGDQRVLEALFGAEGKTLGPEYAKTVKEVGRDTSGLKQYFDRLGPIRELKVGTVGTRPHPHDSVYQAVAKATPVYRAEITCEGGAIDRTDYVVVEGRMRIVRTSQLIAAGFGGNARSNERIIAAGMRRFAEQMRSDEPEVRLKEFDATVADRKVLESLFGARAEKILPAHSQFIEEGRRSLDQFKQLFDRLGDIQEIQVMELKDDPGPLDDAFDEVPKTTPVYRVKMSCTAGELPIKEEYVVIDGRMRLLGGVAYEIRKLKKDEK